MQRVGTGDVSIVQADPGSTDLGIDPVRVVVSRAATWTTGADNSTGAGNLLPPPFHV